MDPDLEALLAAWMGAETSEARRNELLERVRSDAAFQQAFVEEIRMLGMLKAVQSAEPRWLALNEELSPSKDSAQEQGDRDELFSAAVMKKIVRPAQFRRNLMGWAAAASVVLCALALGMGVWRGRAALVKKTGPGLAVIARLSGDGTILSNGRPAREGEVVTAGRLQMAAGSAALSFFNGATLYLEGATEIDLLAMDRVACRAGRLRVRAEGSAAGFTLTAPGVAVVDLGTEFAFNVNRDGHAELHVFEGQVEASLLNGAGYTLSSELLNANESARIAPGALHLDRREQQPGGFASARPLHAGGLALDERYAATVREAGPRAYWRFQKLEDGRFANEIPGGSPLAVFGDLGVLEEKAGNCSVEFRTGEPGNFLLMEGEWKPPAASGYAVELWLTSAALRLAAVVSLVEPPAPGQLEKHFLLVELMERSGRWLHPDGSVRFLQRLPAGTGGGFNVFSGEACVPGRWHHVVAQNVGNRLEIWIDGRLAGATPVAPVAASGAYELLIGRLTRIAGAKSPRSFCGRIDELAVYERALTAREISSHHAFGSSRSE